MLVPNHIYTENAQDMASVSIFLSILTVFSGSPFVRVQITFVKFTCPISITCRDASGCEYCREAGAKLDLRSQNELRRGLIRQACSLLQA